MAALIIGLLSTGIAAGSGLAAWHYGGWPGVLAWLVFAIWAGHTYAPNGWDDVY